MNEAPELLLAHHLKTLRLPTFLREFLREYEKQARICAAEGVDHVRYLARLTGALLDRLTHHVNILEMNGESYRLTQSRARLANPSN